MGCIFGITDDAPLHFTFKYTVMKLKKYGAIGVMEWQLNLKAGKATVHVEFKGGFENKYGIHPATFMTTDPIVQTVIERSYYFASGKIKLLDVKDLGLSSMEIAAQKRKAEEIAKKKKAEEAAKAETKAKAEADAQAKAQAGNAEGQAMESPGTVASDAASEDAADEAELENETEEVAENEEAEENAVDGSVYDVEGETTSGVDTASDEGEYTVVKVTCNEDAKDYLVDNFNCSASKLRNWDTILATGKANGVLFEK